MCGHVFMYHDRDHLQRHRPEWRCGTCGRVSRVPLDCCARPDFARQQPVALTQILGQWVSGCGRWTLARVRLLWRGQGQPANRTGNTHGSRRPEGVVTAGVRGPTAECDERPEMEDMAVAAGDRM